MDKDTRKKNYNDIRHYFKCSNELWKEFGDLVKEDPQMKNKSNCLRYFITEYINEHRVEHNSKDSDL